MEQLGSASAPITYVPREGIDYMTDLYQVIGVAYDMPEDELKTRIRQVAAEWHPDRLDNMAPELRRQGAAMTVQINRARKLLLDGAARAEYDELLGSWEGPVSTDGMPIISAERYQYIRLALQDEETLRTAFTQVDEHARVMTGYRERPLQRLEARIAAGEVLAAEDRQEYEELLLGQDRMLAIQHTQRLQLFGIDPYDWHHAVTADYQYTIGQRVAQRRESMQERRRELLTRSTRLALLAGDEPPVGGTVGISDQPLDIPEPAFLRVAAEESDGFAVQRADILRKRLENTTPYYPMAELQPEPQAAVIFGLMVEEGPNVWAAVACDVAAGQAEGIVLGEDLEMMLDAGNYQALFDLGYSIITTIPMENIDNLSLLNGLLQHHVQAL